MKFHPRSFGNIALIMILSSIASIGASVSKTVGPIAILGALPSEIRMLSGSIHGRSFILADGVQVYRGDLEGRPVVLAMCGEGKVNAAMATTVLKDFFHPSMLIFTGIAGGVNPRLHPGDIVIGAKTFQHDFGYLTNAGLRNDPTKNPFTGANNPFYFQASPVLLRAAERAMHIVHLKPIVAGGVARTPVIQVGVIATGDQFIASSNKVAQLRSKFHADAVEMEGAAVAQVCHAQNIPCLIIRSLSDSANETAKQDIARFYQVAANNSATLVKSILRSLSAKEGSSATGSAL